jgi:hypothetical protein
LCCNYKRIKYETSTRRQEKSLGKLPAAVRNKMGFMAKGGVAKKKKKK